VTFKPSLILAVVGALVLGLYVNAGGQSGGSTAAVATKVATVELQKIINECDKQAANRAANQAKQQQLQAEQQRRQQEVVALQNEIDPLQPGSEAWMNKREQIQEKTLQLEVWARMQEQNQQLEQARQFATIYQAATDAAAAVAEAQGYDIVLQTGELPDLMRLNIEGLRTVVQTRKVIYASDTADLTAAVLQRVNAELK
jgi:Skp family chaperone for outer membrane proteins